jgi:hypothetical protein
MNNNIQGQPVDHLNVYRGNNNYIDFSNVWTLGTRENIGNRTNYPKNLLERAGDFGLWIVEDLPRKIWPFVTNPKVVSTALTAFGLLVNSFVFYPTKTFRTVKFVVSFIKIPFWAIRFTAYIVTCELMIATYLRAQGRFTNTELMNEFNRKYTFAQAVNQNNEVL